MNHHFTKASTMLLPVLLILLLLCSLLVAPAIGTTEAAFGTAGDALIVKEASVQDWTQLSQLNIFNQAGSDGSRVIAPYSSGSYTFTIENSASFPFRYCVDVTDENLAQIPMLFRLRDHDNKYILGSGTEWVPISALKGIQGDLSHRSSTEYTLDWMWSGTDNSADTASGIFAQSGAVYTLNFNIHAEQSGPAVGTDTPPKTGDSAALPLAAALMLLSFIALLVLLIPAMVRKRRQAWP